MKYLRTSEVAKAAGVHPNTVRRYVDRGLLPPVEHSPSGYRRFTQRHLDCLRLARQIYCNQYPGKALHQSGMRIIQATVSGDLEGALELAYSHLALVQSERAQTDVAAATRPITATSWKNSWSPKPVPTAPARACVLKAGS